MPFDLDKMYCGAVRRGDVFLVEEENGKQRAIVILQDNILNDGLPTVVCAPVAPYEKGEIMVNEVLLKKSETGLGQNGICLLHKMMTCERERLVTKKGELKPEKLQEFFKALDVNLGRFRDRKE